MQQYLELMRYVRKNGKKKNDRTKTGTLSIFGYQMRFDLQAGFPLVTTKKCHIKSIIHELLWFLKGSTNIQYLNNNNVNIWNEWADITGELGPIYGKQWCSWSNSHEDSINQIQKVIDEIRINPNSRRLIVSAWNVADLKKMALPPCHMIFQFYVLNGKLSCHLYQRSADIFLGLPFNIASYSLLTMMLAQVTKLEIGEFIHTLGDAHIYLNHLKQVDEQLSRQPYTLPTIHLNPNITCIFSFSYEDFSFLNHQYHPHIDAPISV